MYYDMYGNEYGSQEEADQADASYNAQMNGAGGGDSDGFTEGWVDNGDGSWTYTDNNGDIQRINEDGSEYEVGGTPVDVIGNAETGDGGGGYYDTPTGDGYGPPAPDPSLGGDGYGPPAPAPAPVQPGGGSNVLPPVTITTPRGPTGHTPPPAPDLLPMPQLPPGIGGSPIPKPPSGYHTTPTGDVYGPPTPAPAPSGYHTTPTGDVYGPPTPAPAPTAPPGAPAKPGDGDFDWKKWLPILLGGGSLIHDMTKEPYNPTSAADLLKKQPSNTPTWSADQTAAMRQPLQLGNHPGAYGGSSIVAGDSMPLTMSQFGQQLNAAPRQLPTTLSPLGAGYQATNPPGFAEGGSVSGALSMLGDSGQAFSGAVQGDDPGQSDLIDAKLSAGEYVLDAETVSMLGDGNTAAGVAKLDELRQKLREQKRSAPNGEIPDAVQGPLTSLLGGQANG